MINTIIEAPRPRYAQTSVLPREILARLNSLNTHNNELHRQRDSFSLVYPHADAEPFRWYAHLEKLPYFHVILTWNHGNTVILNTLLPESGMILCFHMNNGVWIHKETCPEAEVAALLPQHFSANASWLNKPATRSQIATVANRLLLPKTSLPRLTAYNACQLIRTSLIVDHLDTLRAMIETQKQQLKQLQLKIA